MKRIYVATSWRNYRQAEVVKMLRLHGHDVYDFRNPTPGKNGFSWKEIDPNYQEWSRIQYLKALEHPVAEDGFWKDMTALESADVVILLLPCGRSAHLELGWAVGAGKPTAIIEYGNHAARSPELMYKMVDRVCISDAELQLWIEGP